MKKLLCLLTLVWSTTLVRATGPTISCGPLKKEVVNYRSIITSLQSGNWSDVNTWSTHTLPAAGDHVVIDQNSVVTLDTDATVSGMDVNGILTFTLQKTITLQSNQNIIVQGSLHIQPMDPNSIQTIRFIGINETNFVGGGMDPIASDIGLWVIGSGSLFLEGSAKKSYVHALGDISANANVINLDEYPDGWKVGDDLSIAPTLNGSRYFDESSIKAISINSNGKAVTLNSNTSQTHPTINSKWSSEVINLTRNVRIEGTVNGRTHVFIRSTIPQRIVNVQVRYIGPRKQQSGSSETEFILGRYGLHFHHCMNGSIGTIVDGCVIRDAGSHAYVPHMSDGITMTNNVAYKCIETPFWWDVVDPTNDVKWIGNIAANLSFIPGSIGLDTDGAPTFGVHGFVLGMGDNNICDSNVVIGQIGNVQVNGGYDWEEMPVESAWEFKDNLVHNSDCGLRGWQNNQKNHVIENVNIYNCDIGIFHGAYGNNYTYKRGYLYASEFQDHAGSQENAVRLLDMTLDGGNIVDYPFHMVSVDANLKGQRPILIVGCTLKNGKLGAILDESNILKSIDLINCNITGNIKNTSSVEIIRIQPTSGQSYQIKSTGTTNIASFAASNWGNGVGLKGEYYNNTNFTSLALTRIDPIILFEEWLTPVPGNTTGVHYSIVDQSYSIRYTGFIEPQYNESYKFLVNTGGGVRLWINGVQVLNKWSEPYPITYTSSAITLQAGKKYSIKLEYYSEDDKSNLSLYWQSTTLKKEIVPQSQLYPDTTGTIVIPPPPVNQLPIVSAGNNGGIDLVINLSGTASDPDGTVVSYLWQEISGPSCTIETPNVISTKVTGLNIGTYQFRLTVTDDKGGQSSSDVIYVIK